MTEIELAGETVVVDPHIARKLQVLSGSGWYLRSGYLAFTPRAADVKNVPGLERDRVVSLGTLIYLLEHGRLPGKGMVCTTQNGDARDFRLENLVHVTRQELAMQSLKTARNPEGGISELPSGRFRARAYYQGKLRAIPGTFATREEALEARRRTLAEVEAVAF